MTPPVFVLPGLHGCDPRAGLLLDGAEGRHAARVRRVAPGEAVDVVDGEGTRARGRVSTVAGDTVRLDVLELVTEPRAAPRLVVVQALPKGDRGELAVELLTEVGVDVVVPWQAARCLPQWKGERGQKSLQRWRSTAREAGKQARRARFPEVRELASTAEVAVLLGAAALGLVLVEQAPGPLAGVAVPTQGDVVVVVGPEGGFADAEIAELEAAGGLRVRLGASVLRTSTAGVAAVAVLSSRTSRWA